MKIVVIAVIFCIIGNSCVWHDHTNRNEIVFNSSLEEVESTISKLNTYFEKIRYTHRDTLQILNYYWRDSVNFKLCATDMESLSIANLDTVFFMQNFTHEEKEDFIQSILFLKGNHLSGMYLWEGWNVYFYDYRFIGNERYFLRHLFYYNNSVDTFNIMRHETLLDRKGNLFLVRYLRPNEQK